MDPCGRQTKPHHYVKRNRSTGPPHYSNVLVPLLLVLAVLANLALAARVTKLTVDSNGNNNDLDIFTTSKPTALVKINQNKRRDLGLLALKAILLGPLIGLTIKAALIRGLLWAVLAYGLHLFFPALLGSLGLGTGLVGFARQLRPDYNQMLVAYFVNLLQTLPTSVGGLSGQYRQLIAPIVEAFRSIPEGHCRYRAVCETASQLIRSSRSMSTSLQRISATVYMNFGNDYSKAWLDGVVQSDCAVKYAQCSTSPFSMVAARLAQSIGSSRLGLGASSGMPGPWASGFTTPAAALAETAGEHVAAAAAATAHVASTVASNIV